jgi:hypothetical protein
MATTSLERKQRIMSSGSDAKRVLVLRDRLARLQNKENKTSIDEIGIDFIEMEITKLDSGQPKDWNMLQGGGRAEADHG